MQLRPLLRRYGFPALIFAFITAVAWVLRGQLRHLHSSQISSALSDLSWAQLVQASLLTLLTYALLPGYDLLALRYVRRRIGTGRAVLASAIAYAISHTLGFPAVTGGAVRARFWSSWGLTTGEIATAVGFAGFTFVLAVVAVTGTALLVGPALPFAHTAVAIAIARAVGFVAVSAVTLYLMWAMFVHGRPLRVAGRELPAPSGREALAQVALGYADWIAAAAVLHVLLPFGHGISFAAFVAMFVVAQVLGLVSHLPGGIGVFESLIVLQFGGRVPLGELLAAMMAYRVVFYLAPFVLGVTALAVYEVWLRRGHIRTAAGVLGSALERWALPLLPSAIGMMTLCGGIMLLLSGATPEVSARLRLLVAILPLGIVELSHFAGSVAGASLLVLGWALTRKLDAAWSLACALLGVGIAASLLKGFDWEEAATLSVILLILLPNRALFYRRSSLTSETLTRGWIASILAIAIASVCVGLFAYKHVEYNSELWWRFALHADAPRFLRASMGGLTTLGVIGLVRLLRHGRRVAAAPNEGALATIRELLPGVENVEANLALLGDKEFLVSERRDAFLMYAVHGRTWVALHEPFGEPAAVRALAWEFLERADRAGGWPVFYQISPGSLPLFVEMGCIALKLGEEAYVSLEDFSLDGGSSKSLRRMHRDAERDGATFEVVRREAVASLIPQLRAVSDDWLSRKAAHEKGFSLGVFDPAYLRNFDISVVRRNGRIVAFANVLTGAGRDASADLMRYSSDAPRGVMDYLFAELILWARREGYQRFSLGMAPLSGLDSRTLAPRWSRWASLVYLHGESMYNFRGLRAYKEKFHPRWEPRYLATPHRFALPWILADVASIISGGSRRSNVPSSVPRSDRRIRPEFREEPLCETVNGKDLFGSSGYVG
jgi:phosphatidylglycerol lysyltransferase